MAIPELPSSKTELRKTMRKLLAARTGQSRGPIEDLTEWLNGHPGLQNVATFSPLPGEPDLSELAESFSGISWVYPRVLGNELEFFVIENPEKDLLPGSFGILEPASATTKIDLKAIDAFFCPGLAFDPNGGRLGRGKGFYDRALAKRRPDSFVIGVCFPEQLVLQTFTESHDIRMDLVFAG